jgi:transcriptional regulator with XRE-family HTH domain
MKRETTQDFRGDRMESLRREFNWTLNDLSVEVAKSLGREVSEAQLSLIENGKRLPSLQLAMAISRALQSSLDYLCGISEFDRTSAGDDEVTVVVHGEAERQRVQRLAYRFLDLDVPDQDRVIDLVGRLGGKEILTDQQRFARALETLAELVGTEAAEAFKSRLS